MHPSDGSPITVPDIALPARRPVAGMRSWVGVFEVLAACVVLAGTVWFVRRRVEWSRGRKAGAIGSCTIVLAALAFAGALGCAGTHLESVPGDPGYCSNSNGNTWLAFSLVAAVTGLAVLARGAALVWIDRARPSPQRARR